MLIAPAIILGVVGEVKSTYVILAIVILNAIVGFIREYRAEKSMENLRKMAANQAQVLRNGQALSVEASDLVPGDVTLLEAGKFRVVILARLVMPLLRWKRYSYRAVTFGLYAYAQRR